jgi:hypothetical protein
MCLYKVLSICVKDICSSEQSGCTKWHELNRPSVSFLLQEAVLCMLGRMP